jgi:hypothetical protein
MNMAHRVAWIIGVHVGIFVKGFLYGAGGLFGVLVMWNYIGWMAP